MANIHEVIGWFNCANLKCRKPLGQDHVTLLTTTHLRRFCDVECITEGKQAWNELVRHSGAGDPLNRVPPAPPAR